jgi:hypothetical protein
MEEYIHHGTRLKDNGVGYSLKCHPIAEASVYGGRPYQLWDTGICTAWGNLVRTGGGEAGCACEGGCENI